MWVEKDTLWSDKVIGWESHCRGRLLPYELLVREVPKAWQTINFIATSVDYMPKLNSKILFLKTPYTLTAEHGEIKLGDGLETSTLLAGFYSARRGHAGSGRELSPIFLLGYGPCVQKYQRARQDVPDCALVARHPWGRPSGFWCDFSFTP